MKQSKFDRIKRQRAEKSAALTLAEARVDRAIDAARNRYTGFLGSKGSVFDDPAVRKAMAHRDRILRDLGKLSRR